MIENEFREKTEGKSKRKKIIITSITLFILIFMILIRFYHIISYNIKIYNNSVTNYNVVAVEYNKLAMITSIDNIDGMLKEIEEKKFLENGFRGLIYTLQNRYTPKDMKNDSDKIIDEMNDLLYDYRVMQQITCPTEEWILDRLSSVKAITNMQAVTIDHDPNELLNKEGGYTSCIYFNVSNIDPISVPGLDIVDKGTDVGGAIEVYSNIKDAINRCNYLSEFDNTLLYSGSYALVGTMVIRTSYALSNEMQSQLTNDITYTFTELK